MIEIAPGIKVGDTVSFSLRENIKAVIPTDFSTSKIVALLDANSAQALIDPVTLHSNIYPLIPDGEIVNDPEGYVYLKVQLPNGDYTAVGLPWINSSTLVKKDSTTVRALIGNVNTSDLERLKLHLAAGGWTLLDTEIV